jgi:hypothetical protein
MVAEVGGDSTCGTGPDGQPTDPALVSHKFDINNAVCRRNEPKREYYWIPETKSHAPHCSHLSYEEACTSHDEEDDFEAYGELLMCSCFTLHTLGRWWR